MYKVKSKKLVAKVEWTKEERDRIVGAFELLIKMDKKLNPHLYTSASHNLPSKSKKDIAIH